MTKWNNLSSRITLVVIKQKSLCMQCLFRICTLLLNDFFLYICVCVYVRKWMNDKNKRKFTDTYDAKNNMTWFFFLGFFLDRICSFINLFLVYILHNTHTYIHRESHMWKKQKKRTWYTKKNECLYISHRCGKKYEKKCKCFTISSKRLYILYSENV